MDHAVIQQNGDKLLDPRRQDSPLSPLEARGFGRAGRKFGDRRNPGEERAATAAVAQRGQRRLRPFDQRFHPAIGMLRTQPAMPSRVASRAIQAR